MNQYSFLNWAGLMLDILGYRRKLGLLVASTNTVAIPDAVQMSLTGVTFSVSDARASADPFSPTAGASTAVQIDELAFHDAGARLKTRAPDCSILLLDEDLIGADSVDLEKRAQTLGLPLPITPSAALAAAVQTLPRRRIALLSPFFPSDHIIARARLETLGCTVVRDDPLCFPTPVASAQTTFVRLREAYQSLIGDDIDAVVQLGHNVPLGRLVNNLEEDFGLPVFSINQICIWHALRRLGVEDAIPGVGRLCLDH